MKIKFYSLLIALVTCSTSSNAQVSCYGEAIKFRETFGAGSNPASLAPGRTTYNYSGNNSPLSEGDYRLHKNSQGRPEWFHSFDHTGNTDGRMMVVNAGFSAGEFYRSTADNLIGGINYTVYLYVMNVNTPGSCAGNAILPKLQFIVEYSSNNTWIELVSFTSAFIPQTDTATWVRISSGFLLPEGISSVRYRILNNSSGGCGNDLAIDDITFSQCAALIPLPVKGLSLNVSGQNNTATINFSTASEYNSRDFEVQKSLAGQDWQTIATIPASGYSNLPKYYSTVDNNVTTKLVYYSIKQIDIDGIYSYSPVVVYRTGDDKQGGLMAYPNPFTSKVSLQYKSTANKAVVLRLTNITGQTLQTVNWNVKKGQNILPVDAAEKLIPGLYFVELRDEAGKVITTEKIIKK